MHPNQVRSVEPLRGKQEFYLIQCLRGLAALMVVAHHGFYEANERLGNSSWEWLNGASGVDIFFVISGFVMAISSRRLIGNAAPALTFLKRRLERVVPLYWFFTTLKVLLLTLAPAVAAHALGGRWNILSSYLFIPSKDADGFLYPVLVVGWTLNFEMLFYGLFALALASRVHPLYLLTPALVLLSLIPAVLQHPPTALAFWGSPLILEFLFGMLLAEFAPRLLRLGSPGLGLLAFATGTTLLFCFAPWAIISPWRFLAWGVPALLLVATAIQLEPVYGTEVPRWLLRIGDASYSIYLAHTFVLSALASALHRLHSPVLRSTPLVVLLSLLLGTLSGLCVYQIVELPIIHFFKRRHLMPTAIPA